VGYGDFICVLISFVSNISWVNFIYQTDSSLIFASAVQFIDLFVLLKIVCQLFDLTSWLFKNIIKKQALHTWLWMWKLMAEGELHTCGTAAVCSVSLCPWPVALCPRLLQLNSFPQPGHVKLGW